jgi:hypothetical protein
VNAVIEGAVDDVMRACPAEAIEDAPVKLFEIASVLLLGQVALLLAYSLPDLINRLLGLR